MPISSCYPRRSSALRAGLPIVLSVVVLLLASCGETYRPIAIPIPEPGGDPKNPHYAVVLSTGEAPGPAGTAVIDVAGETDISNRTAGTNPVHASLPSANGRAWVVNNGDDSVTSFFPGTLAVNDVSVNLEAGSRPTYVDATSTFVFVNEPPLNRVAIVNANLSVATAFVGVGNNPVALAARPDGRKCYVANKNDGTVSVISSTDLAVTGTIPVGASPVAMEMQTAGSFVYVASQSGNTLSVIDTTLDVEVQRVPGLSAPFQVIWDNNLQRVYVLNGGNNTVSIFNAATPSNLTLLRTVPLSGNALAFAVLDNASKFYVLYGGSPGTVDVFDAKSFALRTTVTVQNDPQWIAASPGAEKVFVVNRLGSGGNPATDPLAKGSISIIKTQSDTVLNIPPAQPHPVYVAVQ